jgi:hypothetical protein
MLALLDSLTNPLAMTGSSRAVHMWASLVGMVYSFLAVVVLVYVVA